MLTISISGTRRGRRDNEYGNSVKGQGVSLLWLFSSSYFGGEAELGDAKPLSSIASVKRQSSWKLKMRESSNKSQSTTSRFSSEKHSFGRVWRDLQEKPHWKYEQLSPVQLLEKSDCHRYPPDEDELRRANWFWNRRPRWLQAASYIIWLTVAIGVPLWLFIFPAIVVNLLVISAVIANTEIVQSVRWRRQYELSIDRLIRTRNSGRDTFDMDIFA